MLGMLLVLCGLGVSVGEVHMLVIPADVVVPFEGYRVTVSNFWEDEYRDASGASRVGPSARVDLSRPGEKGAYRFVVGVGSRFTVGEWVFDVEEVASESRVVRLKATRASTPPGER